MILTDKAKEDFLKWLKNNYDLLIEDCGGFSYFWNAQTKVSEYALIIEWLDSVDIFINSSGLTLSKSFISDVSINQNMEFYYDGFKTRSEATQQAILKANEIYNNLNTNENENN